MARHKKLTVDYFPHSCTHGRTMQIIKTKYGNNGRAFWWTLLEIIGKTDNHIYDTSDSLKWEFLVSETLVDDITATEILDLLAKLEAIDTELWENKIIWCQHFVDGIADVYRKRGAEIPLRPPSCDRNSTSKGQSVTETPQSKVKESKGKERKETNMAFLTAPHTKEYQEVKEIATRVIEHIKKVCHVSITAHPQAIYIIGERLLDGYTERQLCQVVNTKSKDPRLGKNDMSPKTLFNKEKIGFYLDENPNNYDKPKENITQHEGVHPVGDILGDDYGQPF